jgi:GDPmannose 4,6-dehydratase
MYRAAKSFAHEVAAIYRARGMHVSSTILYNYESPTSRVVRRPQGRHRGRAYLARVLALGIIHVLRD